MSYTATEPDGDGKMDVYTLNGDPLSAGSTGELCFLTEQSGIIHFNTCAPATASDPPIS